MPRVEPAEQRWPIVVAQLVVELALARLQIAVQRLLGLGRQFRGDLLLGAAQDERPQRPRQQARVAPASGLRPAPSLEDGRLAEHAGVEELEQAPQFAEVVLDRRAAQRQPMVGP